jgi:dTDP-4-amino-4,6-dideoxy-D-galactose acyltransferase
MKINRLEWDSSFFGYEVAKLESQFIESELINLPYKLVYVFSLKPIENKSLFDADTKVEMEKIGLQIKEVSIIRFNEKVHDFDELLDLVFLSGIYSRFKTDVNFRNNEFEKMYTIWIKNAIFNSDNYTMVKIIEKKLVGFVIINLKKDFGRIELISVNDKYQNKGIGKELIQASENICVESGLDLLKVATQGKNANALKLYEKNGFKKIEEIYLYHYWNNETL